MTESDIMLRVSALEDDLLHMNVTVNGPSVSIVSEPFEAFSKWGDWNNDWKNWGQWSQWDKWGNWEMTG